MGARDGHRGTADEAGGLSARRHRPVCPDRGDDPPGAQGARQKVVVEQRHKAESDIAVAAASVIAREIFLRAIADMTAEVFGPPSSDASQTQKVPAGSSDPRVKDLAEEMVRRDGPTWLMNHCKAHFKTTDAVLAACGFSRGDLPPEGQVVSATRKLDVSAM